jgi:hypothetical protein
MKAPQIVEQQLPSSLLPLSRFLSGEIAAGILHGLATF